MSITAMRSISNFVCTTSYAMTAPQFQLSRPAWWMLTSLNRVHAVWRWYRRATLYKNPDNFTQLLGGHLINLVFGHSTLVRIAAQTLCIATRLHACVEAQIALYKESQHLFSVIRGDYTPPVDLPWPVNSPYTYYSPSSVYDWQMTTINTQRRMADIAKSLAATCQKAFILSMCLMDTIDAFYISPVNQNEAINESCLNIITWINTAIEKREFLLQGIAQHRKIVEIILKNSPVTYAQVASI